MTRRERMVVASIRSHHMGSSFHRIDHCSHDCRRESIRSQHPAPGAPALHTSHLHTKHHGSRQELRIIIEGAMKLLHIIVAQTSKMRILSLDYHTSCYQRCSHKSHLIEL